MPAHAMKLFTVVCEASAREAITLMLEQAGADECMFFPVAGNGPHAARLPDAGELPNVRIEAIVSADLCGRLMARLEQEVFPHHALIAFESDITVRRPAKFF